MKFLAVIVAALSVATNLSSGSAGIAGPVEGSNGAQGAGDPAALERAGSHSGAPSRLLVLRDVAFEDIDTDGDRLISFDELLEIDASALSRYRDR